MNSYTRFGTSLAAVVLAVSLTSCAGPKPRSASNFGGRVDSQNIGLATRAQVALSQNKLVEAVQLAERSVAASPTDAGFRGLLGNCYFAAGRFASAESAYRDSLTLLSNQPQVVLKMALVSVAQGKTAQAIGFLEAAKGVLDPADYGLALALAGQPQDAASVLQQAAQQVGADARVRQNLALALALSGDWTAARGIAAQDLAADQIDGRIQQWMQLAKPTRASDQVASLTGISPAASDPGQPVRLALKDGKTRLAALTSTTLAPVSEAAPIEVAEIAPAMALPPPAEAAPMPQSDAGAPMIAEAPAPVTSLVPRSSPRAAARPSLSPRAASLTDARMLYRRASLSTKGRSRAVVQLGAYSTHASVGAAWTRVSARFGSLRGYSPVAARFDGERGTVYRLSVQGFGSARDALNLCGSLKRAGGACFVRNIAGDAPVQLASR